MASIQKRTGKRGTTWRVSWREPDGAQRSETFPTQAAARRKRIEVEQGLLDGSYVRRADSAITFRECAEQWRTSGTLHRDSTATTTEIRLRKHAYPTFGHRPIGSIRRDEIQAWVQRLSEKLAPATVHAVYSNVATVFKTAQMNGIIARTPCVKINLPKRTPNDVKVPSLEVVAMMRAALPARYQAVTTLIVGSGMRISEALGLSVDRVNFLGRTIQVDRQLYSPNRGPTELLPYTKSDAGMRTIPVGQGVINALAAHLATYGTGPQGVIFTNRQGEWIRRSSWNSIWVTARRRARDRIDLKGAHQLRHLYASALIREGVDPKTIQTRLGHASITETFDTYGHLWPDDEDRTRDAIERAMEGFF